MSNIGKDNGDTKRRFEDLSSEQQDELIESLRGKLIEMMGRDKFFLKLMLQEPDLVHKN